MKPRLALLLVLGLYAAAGVAQDDNREMTKIKEQELEEVRERISELKQSLDRRVVISSPSALAATSTRPAPYTLRAVARFASGSIFLVVDRRCPQMIAANIGACGVPVMPSSPGELGPNRAASTNRAPVPTGMSSRSRRYRR